MQLLSRSGVVLFEADAMSLKELRAKACTSGANLTDANLTNANLMNANLTNASLTNNCGEMPIKGPVDLV